MATTLTALFKNCADNIRLHKNAQYQTRTIKAENFPTEISNLFGTVVTKVVSENTATINAPTNATKYVLFLYSYEAGLKDNDVISIYNLGGGNPQITYVTNSGTKTALAETEIVWDKTAKTITLPSPYKFPSYTGDDNKPTYSAFC